MRSVLTRLFLFLTVLMIAAAALSAFAEEESSGEADVPVAAETPEKISTPAAPEPVPLILERL